MVEIIILASKKVESKYGLERMIDWLVEHWIYREVKIWIEK